MGDNDFVLQSPLPTIAELQARPELLALSPTLQDFVDLGTIPSNIPRYSAILTRYMLKPMSLPQELAPVTFSDWVEGAKLWRAACDHLQVAHQVVPYPFNPHLDWISEASSLNWDLHLDHYRDVQRLIEYAQPGSKLFDLPNYDLTNWCQPESGLVWPANSLNNIPSSCFLTELTGAEHECLPHQEVDWQQSLPLPLKTHGFPWAKDGQPGVVLAGGAVTSMLMPKTVPSDYDLFLIVPSKDLSPEERVEKARLIISDVLHTIVKAREQVSPLYVYADFLDKVVNIVCLRCPLADMDEMANAKADMVYFKAQIILRLYETPAQVVHGFDIDACSILFDGRDVLASSRMLRSMHTRTLLVHPLHQSPSYEYRLAKYAKRYGMRILVPGLVPDLRQAVVNYWEGIKEFMLKWFKNEEIWCISDVEFTTQKIELERKAGLEKLLLMAMAEVALEQLSITLDEREKVIKQWHRSSRGKDKKPPELEGQYRLARYEVHLEKLAKMITGQRMHPSPHLKYCRDVSDYEFDGFEGSVGVLWAHRYEYCKALIRARPGESGLPAETTRIGSLLRRCEFQTSLVHLQSGQQLFSGSFTAKPFDDWYAGAIARLQEVDKPHLDQKERAQRMAGLDIIAVKDKEKSKKHVKPSRLAVVMPQIIKVAGFAGVFLVGAVASAAFGNMRRKSSKA